MTLTEERSHILSTFERISMNSTPQDAMLLRILISVRGAKRGVEIGAATGFGAMNMGIAFERNGGMLQSLESNPGYVAQTRENIGRMRLEAVCSVVEGSAIDTIPTLEPGIDFVFIDAKKAEYFQYIQLLEPKLAPHALIVADNVIKQRPPMEDYLQYVFNSPDYETVIVQAPHEKGDGMALSYRVL